MTDDTDERPFQLSDGECVVFDPEYLDPETEAVGVLAVQYGVDKGLWTLFGYHDDLGRYFQEWRETAPLRAGGKLRPVN